MSERSVENVAATSTQGGGSPLAYGWVVVLALWPVAMLNYLDRQMISTIRASMRADIPSIASDQDFGTLMAVFMWTYAALSPVGGYVADRFNRRWTVIGSLGVWSAVTWLTGHMHSYHGLLVTRALMGISEACYIPAALALIADFHPGHTRAKAVGIHQSGIYAGMILGGLGGYVAQLGSWRNCFTWFGMAGVVYAFVLMAMLRDAPDTLRRAGGPPVRIVDTLRALFSRSFGALCICFTLVGSAGWIIKNWLPTFLSDRFQLSEGMAGIWATGYIHPASFVGVLLGGALADRWTRTSVRGRILTSALGMALMAPAMLGLGIAPSVSVAVGFMVVFGLGWGAFDTNNMPILCQIARPEHRATGYGIMNLVSIATGGGVTLLLGWMRDHGLPFAWAFALCAVLALGCAAIILLVRPRQDIASS